MIALCLHYKPLTVFICFKENHFWELSENYFVGFKNLRRNWKDIFRKCSFFFGVRSGIENVLNFDYLS